MTSMTSSYPTTSKRYHLFGFPIAHSASPALHNYIFACLGLQRTYQLSPATHVSEYMRNLCRADDFGGASVTMPLKVTVAGILDRVTDEASAIGAVNTIVQEYDEGRKKLIGTNTDWLAVRNALLHHYQLFPPPPTSHKRTMPWDHPAGMVIGGGGAARAALYALASLGCTPIYLVGRDASELDALVAQFPSIACIPVSDPTHAVNVKVVVGCVPAIPPTTPEEIAADGCTRAIFSSAAATTTDTGGVQGIFMDMCYKPRVTPLMLHAASAGWTVVSGIEAMLEQGLAQARMWLADSANPQDSTNLIPPEIEEGARTLIREMPDIVIQPGEEHPGHLNDGEPDVQVGRSKDTALNHFEKQTMIKVAT